MYSENHKDLPGSIGLVVSKNPGKFMVSIQGNRLLCSVSRTLRQQPRQDLTTLQRHKNSEDHDAGSIVVGDQVRILLAGDGTGVIHEVLPRENKFSRRGTGERPYEQVIAANVDQVVAVLSAARPAPKWNLLDRYLVSASVSGVPVVICITKMDLLDPRDSFAETETYEKLGYLVVRTSAAAGTGIGDLRQVLCNRFSVMIGKSGVGKTSLLNAIQPGLGLKIGAVGRESGKGKHTTTSLEMFDLDFGGSILDTPGTREFGLIELEGEDIAAHFPEIKPFL